MNSDFYQKLFNHLHDEHDLTLLQTEMDQIIHIVTDMVRSNIVEDFRDFSNKHLGESIHYLSTNAYVNVKNKTGIIPGQLLRFKFGKDDLQKS